MDTSGKDGTIKHVMRGFNPQGTRVVSFKAPTPQEAAHHFLWRIKKRLPTAGEVVIFNRSHYEDVLAAKVKKLAPPEVIEGRYSQINRFERKLVDSGTTVVKFCLLISFEEQRERLLERLRDPSKRWKFREGDLDDRARWDEYQAAYQAALTRCSTAGAPWYVIPANRKWYRDWVVGRILIEVLKEMNPQYPVVDLDIAALEQRLKRM
jgi:PPK2 family polyphosphate:nucleotide phosphotransferase